MVSQPLSWPCSKDLPSFRCEFSFYVAFSFVMPAPHSNCGLTCHFKCACGWCLCGGQLWFCDAPACCEWSPLNKSNILSSHLPYSSCCDSLLITWHPVTGCNRSAWCMGCPYVTSGSSSGAIFQSNMQALEVLYEKHFFGAHARIPLDCHPFLFNTNAYSCTCEPFQRVTAWFCIEKPLITLPFAFTRLTNVYVRSSL